VCGKFSGVDCPGEQLLAPVLLLPLNLSVLLLAINVCLMTVSCVICAQPPDDHRQPTPGLQLTSGLFLAARQ